MKLKYDPSGSAKNHVLLFYKEYETDRFFPGDRYLKRLVRPIYNAFHHKPKVTGFGVSFNALERGLVEAGYVVHRNAYGLARANPTHPVGLVGGPAILEGWSLPNPAILGPSLYDQPGQAPKLFDDPRFKNYVCLADWMYDMFEVSYPGRCFKWFAGIDADAWPDMAASQKDLDFLIYDKVRWEHERYEAELINPVLRELEAQGLTYQMIRYRHHDHATFKSLLKRSRGLLFLCENETQGLAYQEAMASNVPVLAWDRGYWGDPQWKDHYDAPPAASSVPFFAPKCGERFSGMDDFSAQLRLFVERRNSYRPREYVLEDLSFAKSAQIYADAYFKLAK